MGGRAKQKVPLPGEGRGQQLPAPIWDAWDAAYVEHA